jgi:hypothetical protein
VIGFVLGVVSAFLTAGIARFYGHNIRIGASISKTIEGQSDRPVYRFKLQAGRRFNPLKRFAFDLDISAQLLFAQRGKNPYSRIVEIPLHVAQLPTLTSHRLVRLLVDDPQFLAALDDPDLSNGVTGTAAPLETILTTLPGARIVVSVSGNDSFTGARGITQSAPLTAAAIAFGVFARRGFRIEPPSSRVFD